MARIRTIKPEFVESESVGKLSRDARLLFILLWTIVDDDGRARASSRFLASRLYPYDEDASAAIGGWLAELEVGAHVRLYEVEGNTYLDIPKWLIHQKIDHPSKSRLPEFRETSRSLARVTEEFAPHTLDLGPWTLDQGPKEKVGVAVAPSQPLDEAVEHFNQAAAEHDWPKVQVLNANRKRALAACLKAVGGIEGWQSMLAKAAASDFLTGKSERSNGHANWRMDFDFLTKPMRYTKLMEGGYDNSTSKAEPRTGLSAVLAALAD